MVCKVCDLVNGFSLIVILCGDDKLSLFLADLLEDLIHNFFEEVSCV